MASARALVRDPDVVLFDEPLANLDAKLRVEMRTEIRKLHRDLQATMVYVTYDQVEAMRLADRVVVMNGGLTAPPTVLQKALANRLSQPLIMGIRPEHLTEGAAGPALQMTVENVETLGAHRLVVGTLAGAAFTAQVPASHIAVEGQTAVVAPVPDHLHLFDATTRPSLLAQA